jgi:hypothetical protein
MKEDEMAGICSTHGETRNVYTISDENPERVSQFGRPMHMWQDINIKIELKEIRREIV